MPTLMTPAQVAELLGVTEHALAAWRSTKRVKLPYVKVGHLVRYDADDVTSYIHAQKKD